MRTVQSYLDQLIERGIAKNDSDIARRLGRSRAAVSRWRKDLDVPDDEAAAALEQMLDKRPGELMAEFQAARAKTPAMRSAWENVARICASAGLVMTVGTVSLLGVTQDPFAAASQLVSSVGRLCIM